jgi:pyruvate/2-oxoglutarate dehydrogenase complex dihydrolipoamide acyltransferase (E2) component
MATRIVMSKLSPTMEEGRVLQWVKKEGDTVESGDVVVEVETDKANMEVEAVGSGILKKILVPENATVPTGTILGVIALKDEDISDILADATAVATAATAPAPEQAAAPAEQEQTEKVSLAASTPDGQRSGDPAQSDPRQRTRGPNRKARCRGRSSGDPHSVSAAGDRHRSSARASRTLANS